MGDQLTSESVLRKSFHWGSLPGNLVENFIASLRRIETPLSNPTNDGGTKEDLCRA